MRTVLASAIILGLATPAAAQQGTAVSGLGALYGATKNFVTRAAEQMPEEHFAFTPTPEVRTFGSIVGHIADANYYICALALGEDNPNSTELEKTTSKAALVTAIKASYTYCDTAYQMTDAKGIEPMSLFGMSTNRLGALAFVAGHGMEHYGNLVTYMRMKGLVPPSSQQTGM